MPERRQHGEMLPRMSPRVIRDSRAQGDKRFTYLEAYAMLVVGAQDVVDALRRLHGHCALLHHNLTAGRHFSYHPGSALYVLQVSCSALKVGMARRCMVPAGMVTLMVPVM